MRNKMNSSRIGMAMVAAIGSLALTMSASAFAGTESLAIKNVSVSGGVVLVTVKNVSLAPVASTITVEADVNGMSSFSIVPVVLLPGESTVASAAFTGAVSNVKSVETGVSICDDTVPF